MVFCNQKRLSLLLITIFIGIALSSCCPPLCIDPPGDCVLKTVVMRQASNGLKYTWDPASNQAQNSSRGTEWQYISRDMTLHLRKPTDMIGYAFQIIHDYFDLDDFQLATIFLLQYDLPKQTCKATIDWKIYPQLIFPNGYLIIPENEVLIDVSKYAFVDATGQLDIATTSYDAMGEIALDELTNAIDSNNPDIYRRWYDDHSKGGPVYVPGVLSGQLTVPANTQARLFVGVSVAITRILSGERACTGCGAQIDSLLEAGIFRGIAPGANSDGQGWFGPELVIAPTP